MGEGNAISTEAIAIHTITNIILWSFSVLCIVGPDGQTQGTGTTQIWLYTPNDALTRGGKNV